MNFTQALARFVLVTTAVAAVCLIAVGILLISFPRVFLAAVLFSAGVVFLLMGMAVLVSFLSALLWTKLGTKRVKGGARNV